MSTKSDVDTDVITLMHWLDLEASVAQNLEPFTYTPRNHTDKRALRWLARCDIGIRCRSGSLGFGLSKQLPIYVFYLLLPSNFINLPPSFCVSLRQGSQSRGFSAEKYWSKRINFWMSREHIIRHTITFDQLFYRLPETNKLIDTIVNYEALRVSRSQTRNCKKLFPELLMFRISTINLKG